MQRMIHRTTAIIHAGLGPVGNPISRNAFASGSGGQPWVSFRRLIVFRQSLLLAFIAGLPAVSLAQADAQNREGLEFFEKRIRPVLVEKCYECHSAKAKKIEGGLLLDTRAGIRRGGDRARPWCRAMSRRACC